MALSALLGDEGPLHASLWLADAAALEAYANTPEAGTTWASPDETEEIRSKMTERDYIRLFLNSKRMKRLWDGSGVCTFSYRHSDIGQGLQDAGFLENGGRLYPDAYPCATALGSKLRNCALGAHYMECDDADAFHRYLQKLSSNTLVKTVLEELAALKEEMAVAEGKYTKLLDEKISDVDEFTKTRLLKTEELNRTLLKKAKEDSKLLEARELEIQVRVKRGVCAFFGAGGKGEGGM